MSPQNMFQAVPPTTRPAPNYLACVWDLAEAKKEANTDKPYDVFDEPYTSFYAQKQFPTAVEHVPSPQSLCHGHGTLYHEQVSVYKRLI